MAPSPSVSTSSVDGNSDDDENSTPEHISWRDRLAQAEAGGDHIYSFLPKLQPVEQDDTTRTVLQMSYTEAYKDASDYFRAVVAAKEVSRRALNITADVIRLSPANYSAWYYRKFLVTQMKIPLQAELEFTNSLSLKHQKNYQLWNYRQWLVDQLLEQCAENGSSYPQQLHAAECVFIEKIYRQDAKNYHAWTYRIWLLRRVKNVLDDLKFREILNEEFTFTEHAISDDVYNNSAWNYRFQLVKCTILCAVSSNISDFETIWNRELRFVQKQVHESVVHNESVWSYAFGLVKFFISPIKEDKAIGSEVGAQPLKSLHGVGIELRSQLISYAQQLYGTNSTNQSYHLLGFLVDALTLDVDFSTVSGVESCTPMTDGDKESALTLIDELCELDVIRARYWKFRKQLVAARSSVKATREPAN